MKKLSYFTPVAETVLLSTRDLISASGGFAGDEITLTPTTITIPQ